MSVPFADLGAMHREVAGPVAQRWAKILENTSFVLGPDVREFEDAFAGFSDTRFCVGVGNGTDALELGIRALGVGPGDEVLLPTNSFVATALAVVRAGAVPVLVDVESQYFHLDLSDAARKVTARTRLIIPVHLFGQLADMRAVAAFAQSHDLLVMEDHAQSQGATQGGKQGGSFSEVSATSFYPGKNLGAYGDGGACLTSSHEIYEKLLGLRSYGSTVRYHHPEIGFNSRLDSLQAAVLVEKLARLAEWNRKRREIAGWYLEAFGDTPEVTLPAVRPNNEHIWHLFVVRVARRNAVLKFLADRGIGAAIHYPTPIHLHGAFKSLGHTRGSFPVAERLSDEILSLPMYPHMTREQVVAVRDALTDAIAAG